MQTATLENTLDPQIKRAHTRTPLDVLAGSARLTGGMRFTGARKLMTSDSRPAAVEPANPPTSDQAATGDVYRLGHRWLIRGPIEVVFDVLSQLTEFPTWWSVFKSVESDDSEFGVGASARVRTRVVLPYDLDWDLTVAAIDRPRLIQLDATVLLANRFPMRGPLRFTLTETGDGVEVLNEQVFTSERRLPRPLRAIAQRMFAYNHAWGFDRGGIALQKAVDEAVAERAKATPAS
jgi:uncharacterized protein YndB with AHSA1/START domain